MRIWSLHPKYLDSKGLVALWRETLLAQKVLADETKGYRHHPQLLRFRATRNPLNTIASYLHAVCDEADARDYRFDRTKILRRASRSLITVTRGQIAYEREHLLKKLWQRDRARHRTFRALKQAAPHPLFRIVAGDIENWEIL